MKKCVLCFLSLLLVLTTGCSSSQQFYGAATGSQLGGLFGSAIGGLMGGPRGSDRGVVLGMIAGAAVGAVATAPKHKAETSAPEEYGYDSRPRSSSRPRQYAEAEYLEVTNVRFIDANRNKVLDAGETASIEMEIYNRGSSTLYDVAPIITCNNRRIVISPTAIVSSLPSGRGIRYRAAVRGRSNLKSGVTTFSVAFGQGNRSTVVKQFQLRTMR